MTDHLPSHPTDAYSRSAAHTNHSRALVENFEHAMANDDVYWRCGGLELICAVAIARVSLLERQLAEQEHTVRTRLFQPTGNVENVIPFEKSAGTGCRPARRMNPRRYP